jgi:DNA end-binding protein Ku
MPHALWSGTLSFGIVSIPVQLQTAVHEHAIHFHQISKTDKRRIHYRKVTEGSDDPVADEDIVKGYEVRSGSYVVFSDAELRSLAARKSSVIAIECFVKLTDIDPRYCDTLYYLLPPEVPAKPYQLLLQALTAADRVGIARFIMHGKEHLVMVRSLTTVLGLQTLHFSDEIIDSARLLKKSAKTAIPARELALASQLIDQLSARFTPAAYKDAYVARITKAIARKAKGQAIMITPDKGSEDETGNTLDLMEALERSVKGRSAGSAARRGSGERSTARAALQHPRSATRHAHARSRPHAS